MIGLLLSYWMSVMSDFENWIYSFLHYMDIKQFKIECMEGIRFRVKVIDYDQIQFLNHWSPKNWNTKNQCYCWFQNRKVLIIWRNSMCGISVTIILLHLRISTWFPWKHNFSSRHLKERFFLAAQWKPK